MKKSLLILLCFLTWNISQVKAQDEEDDELIFESDDFFDITESPAAWKNESIVILAQKSRYTYNLKSKKSLKEESLVRTRLFLKDKSAVEKFSQFYISPGQKVAIKITKPDGEIKDVDMSQAIDVEKGINIPLFFTSINLKQVEYQKLAIPELEPGDIIDYIYRSRSEYNPKIAMKTLNKPYAYYYRAASADFLIASSYPKVHYHLDIDISENLSFSYKCLNNAPDFEEVPIEEEKMKRYSIDAENLERIKDQVFQYESRVYPKVKFQIFYNTKPKSKIAPYFVSPIGEVLTEVSEEAIKNAMYIRFSEKYYEDTYKRLLYYTGPLKAKTPEEFAEKIYKNLQTFFYTQYNETENGISSEFFAGMIVKSCAKNKIPYEVVAGIPKNSGELDELLTIKDFIYGVRIMSSKGEPIYLFPFHEFTTLDDRDYRLAGEDAYLFTNSKKVTGCKLERITIPEYEAANNQTQVKINAVLGKDFSVMVVNQVTSHKGEHKGYSADDVLTSADFEHKAIKTSKVVDRKYDRYKGSLQELLERKRLSYMEDEMESDFELQKYISFDLESAGLKGPDDWLSYKEKYNITDIVKALNDSLFIIELGRLISTQYAIGKTDLERVGDVYVNYPRIFDNTITFTIPEGYSVKSIEHLKQKIDNKAGSFESIAIIKKDKLIIHTVKVYKSTYLTEKEWPIMINFLDEAYNFNLSKIILTKN